MTLDLETVAKVLGLIIALSAVAGVFGGAVGLVMTPRIARAVKEHSAECHMSKAIAEEITERQRADARIEAMVGELRTHIDAGFQAVNATLVGIASGRNL